MFWLTYLAIFRVYAQRSVQLKVYNTVKDQGKMYISSLITVCLYETDDVKDTRIQAVNVF